MGGTLAVSNNELIRKRRRKRTIKKAFLLTVLLISTLVILCLKLEYFNVKYVKVSSNKVVSSDEIVESSNIENGVNIFYVDVKGIENNVLKNPYILETAVSRQLPNAISIKVTEREAVFYYKKDDKYYVIDKTGVVLEQRDNINNMKLTLLQGLSNAELKVGSILPVEDNRTMSNLKLIAELIMLNSSGIDISLVDVSNLLNIKVNCGNISIRLGMNDIKEKLNLGLNIIKNNKLETSKGYIDVSFEGTPVVFIEK